MRIYERITINIFGHNNRIIVKAPIPGKIVANDISWFKVLRILSPFLLIRSSNHLNTSAANGQPTSYSSSYHCCTTNLYLYQAPPASARPQLLDIAKRNWYNQQEKRGNLDCNHSTNVQHIEPPPADHK